MGCEIFPNIEIEDRLTPGAENHSRKMFRARKYVKELEKDWKDTLSTSKPMWPTLFLHPFKEKQLRAFSPFKQMQCFMQNFVMGKPTPFIPSQKYIVSMVQRLPI